MHQITDTLLVGKIPHLQQENNNDYPTTATMTTTMTTVQLQGKYASTSISITYPPNSAHSPTVSTAMAFACKQNTISVKQYPREQMFLLSHVSASQQKSTSSYQQAANSRCTWQTGGYYIVNVPMLVHIPCADYQILIVIHNDSCRNCWENG